METIQNTAVLEEPVVERHPVTSPVISSEVAKSRILQEIQRSIERSKSEDPACYAKGAHYQYGKS